MPQLPALNHSLSLELPPIADLSSTLQPLSDKGVTQQPASRSSSLRHRADLPPTPYTAVASTALSQATPQSNTGTRFLDFKSNDPSSPISISSLPSPLFDGDIFDAFPSVPGTTPSASGRYTPRRGEQSLTAAAAATADFDSALLSSAIHLAARNNTSTTSGATQ